MTNQELAKIFDARLKKIIEDCNYVPNSAARGLAGEKTHFIGLVIPDVSDMFYANIIRGVEKNF